MLVLGLIAACARWVAPPTATPAAQWINAERPRTILVSLTDGSQLQLADPVVRADTLFGVLRLSSFGPRETRPAAVPLSAVARIAVQEVNRRATTLALVGVPVAFVLGLLLIGGIDD